MAKQWGTHPFTGKMGATIGYKVNEKYLERENGSKEGKAFKNDSRRWRTMYYAGLFAQASKAVVLIYKRLPEDQRKHGVYGQLSGKAFTMLKNGSTIEEMKAVLTKEYVENKKPLVVVSQEPAIQCPEDGGSGLVIKEDRQSVTGREVADTGLHSASTPETVSVYGQRHMIATIVRPYFCSTISG